MRILILTHHYPPEVGAPQTRLSGTARFLLSRGHYVEVVSAMPSYPNGVVPPEFRGRLFHRGMWDGVPVRRTPTYARPGSSASTRLLNQLSFAVSSLLAIGAVRRPDVILAESPPLFVGASAAIFGRMLSAPIVLHVSDLWPRIPIELGALCNPALIWWAERFESAVYGASRRVIVVTNGWVDHLRHQGVTEDQLRVVTNGVDTTFFDPAIAGGARERVREELGFGDDILFACIGTLSIVYDYDLILNAAEALRDRTNIRLLIAGGGSLQANVVGAVAQRRLDIVTVLPAQPHARVRDLLAAADGAIVALRDLPVTRGQLPVRVLESMAMAQPVVLSGLGESRSLVEHAKGGLTVEPGDAAGLAAAICRLADDPALRQRLGLAGRRLIAAKYSRSSVAGEIETVLLEAALP